jgi:hypothetical protein
MTPVSSTNWAPKRKSEREEDGPRLKRPKETSKDVVIGQNCAPFGFIWDGENYSCAYDSVLTILLSVWAHDHSKWTRRFKDTNRIMRVLATGFLRVEEGTGSLESARNKVRKLLHQRNPALFPCGQVGTPVSKMAEQLLRSDNVITSTWLRCTECDNKTNISNNLQMCVIQCHGY